LRQLGYDTGSQILQRGAAANAEFEDPGSEGGLQPAHHPPARHGCS
jgi:hypothetical protein